MQFRNVVRRISLKLQNCERVGRVSLLKNVCNQILWDIYAYSGTNTATLVEEGIKCKTFFFFLENPRKLGKM